LILGQGITVTDETLTLVACNRTGLRYTAGGGTKGIWDGDIILTNTASGVYLSSDTAGGTLEIGSSSDDTITGVAGNLSLRGSGTLAINSRIDIGSTLLQRDDPGIFVLNSTGNVFGVCNVLQGTFRLGASEALPANTTLTIGKGSAAAIFDLNGKDQTIANLADQHYEAGTGTQKLTSSTSATLIVSNTTANTFGKTGSCIEGAVSLLKLGNGTLTLTGTNTTSGAFAVSNGTLVVSAAGTFGLNSTKIVVGGTGTLTLSNSFAIADAATVAMPAAGVNTAKIYLDTAVDEKAGWLLYGETIMRVGTYGATGSGANHIDDSHFAGNGVLSILHDKSGTLISLK